MMDEQWDAVWRGLGDPSRRRMLDLLVERPRTTGELAEAFPELTRFAVMKHLKVLEKAGLIVVRREGKFRWNTLNPVPLRAIYERWLIRFMEPAAANLLALKRHVESKEQPETKEDPT
jgi:DNA-binding transcriptional ArsR family regulator